MRREDHSVSPPVIRIKPKAFSVVDTADSLTARLQHVTDTWEVRQGNKGSTIYAIKENMCQQSVGCQKLDVNTNCDPSSVLMLELK